MAQAASDESLRIFFDSVDTDSSGSIDEHELQEALAAGNLHFNRPIVAQMIKLFDRDQNGKMSFEEFVSLHKFLSVVQNSFGNHASDQTVLDLNGVYLALQDAGYSLDQPAFYTACQSFDEHRTGKFRLDSYISLCIFLQSARSVVGHIRTPEGIVVGAYDIILLPFYGEDTVALQASRNLFGAFDTRREGRITVDFNQFVYCAANVRL